MYRLSCTIVFVADMDRSIAFYRDVLGLPLKFASPEWTEFANEGATIALHKAAAANSGTSADGAPGTCQLGFEVDNLDDSHARLQSLGVSCVRPPTAELSGVRLAIYADPDGLRFTIAQRAAARAW
jgi:lactoylglutathione lyase